MDGIMYVVNQLGMALSQANARIQQLEQEKAQLIAASQPQETPQPE